MRLTDVADALETKTGKIFNQDYLYIIIDVSSEVIFSFVLLPTSRLIFKDRLIVASRRPKRRCKCKITTRRGRSLRAACGS